MESAQDKVKEFFWELDKQFPANHPFIVLHGPADKFREYLEKNIQDTERIEEIEEDKEELERDVDRLKNDVGILEDGIEDTIRLLKQIKSDEDLTEEIEETLEEAIDKLESLV